jgi:hypothetical protein
MEISTKPIHHFFFYGASKRNIQVVDFKGVVYNPEGKIETNLLKGSRV